MDDICKMFNSRNIFTNDDLEVISFTPSEYLKRQFVLQTLQGLKLSMWIMICDVLDNTKFKSSVGSQLRDGKLFQIHIKHVVAYNYVHMYAYIRNMYVHTYKHTYVGTYVCMCICRIIKINKFYFCDHNFHISCGV